MRIVKKEKVFKGFYQLSKLTLKSERSQETFEREQFKVPNSIGILVHNILKNKIVLVQQFRVGPEKQLLEIVAGKIENENEDIQFGARREVLEETGYDIDELKLIHTFYTCPGPVTEQMSLFYAKVSNQSESGGGLASEHEEITIIEMSVDDFLGSTFFDGKTLIAQQWLQLNKNQLSVL